MLEGIVFLVLLLVSFVIGGKSEGVSYAKAYGEYKKQKDD